MKTPCDDGDKMNTPFLHLKLTTKLLIFNVLIFSIIIINIFIVFTAFENIESRTAKAIEKGTVQIITNTQFGRDLSNIFDRTNLLISTFYRHNDKLQTESDFLQKRIRFILNQDIDKNLKNQISVFSEKMKRLFKLCSKINNITIDLARISDDIIVQMNELEERIADRMIESIMEGQDATPFEQLSVLIPTYRESILIAALSFNRIEPILSEEKDIGPIINTLDDLKLRLRTLTASEPFIMKYGVFLSSSVDEYKLNILKLINAFEIFKLSINELNNEKKNTNVAMGQINNQVVDAFRNMLSKTSMLMKSTTNFVNGLTFIMLTLVSFFTYVFFLLNIKRPIESISNKVKNIRTDKFDTRIQLNRYDEWKIIEEAINSMIRDLKKSHDELFMKNEELNNTHKQLKNNLISLENEIEHRHAAEVALKHDRDFLERIMETSPAGIILVDSDGYVKFANNRAGEVCGFDKEQITHNNYNCILFNLLDLDGTIIPFERLPFKLVVQNGKPIREMKFSIITDEKLKYLAITAAPLFDENRNVIAVVKIVEDITDKKHSDDEREKLQEQLLQSQKMEAIGTLTGGIAHDFNNLLQAIQGYAELLKLKLNDDIHNKTYAEIIYKTAKRGGELTRRLLTFARKVEGYFRLVDINAEIIQTEKLLIRTIPKNITIEMHLDKKLKMTNADPAQIEQILMNLCVNGMDAMPNGGIISIETMNVTIDEAYARSHAQITPGEYIELIISDTGIGMDKETKEQIFDPFFTTKEVGKGTGLGLAVVFGIVKTHSGYINCYSEPGKGTVFKVYLPAADALQQKLNKDETVSTREGKETVMIVDDEDFIIEFTEQALTSYGYKVIKALDGESAIELYKTHQHIIDIIILDLSMPGMSGWECMEHIREINPEALIIVASGFSTNGSRIEAENRGASFFIGKPYELNKLLRVIRELLDKQ